MGPELANYLLGYVEANLPSTWPDVASVYYPEDAEADGEDLGRGWSDFAGQ